MIYSLTDAMDTFVSQLGPDDHITFLHHHDYMMIVLSPEGKEALLKEMEAAMNPAAPPHMRALAQQQSRNLYEALLRQQPQQQQMQSPHPPAGLGPLGGIIGGLGL